MANERAKQARRNQLTQEQSDKTGKRFFSLFSVLPPSFASFLPYSLPLAFFLLVDGVVLLLCVETANVCHDVLEERLAQNLVRHLEELEKKRQQRRGLQETTVAQQHQRTAEDLAQIGVKNLRVLLQQRHDLAGEGLGKKEQKRGLMLGVLSPSASLALSLAVCLFGSLQRFSSISLSSFSLSLSSSEFNLLWL